MEVIGARYRELGLPEEAIGIITSATRDSIRSAYQYAWNVWCSWCFRCGHDNLSNNLSKILLFLSEVLYEGKSYSTVNLYRSKLSSTLDKFKRICVGQQPLIVSLLAGMFNSGPPQPRYRTTWDVDIVLRHFQGSPNESLSLPRLARKLATFGPYISP